MHIELPCCIDPAHASLTGHFPDHPIVPGVVILNEVLRAVEPYCSGMSDAFRMPSAKFLSPLLPGQRFTITIDHSNEKTCFTVKSGITCIVTGILTPESPSSGGDVP
ncbi:hypothetical protein W02_28550 [Nitrospira sp. KM1]|uniref:MaoC/PaaZ C-terminal domain-containing protein n=1 Tax=Nitrospira sp. KM1 TaxID=1936990 RepID=UPI0013A7B206|nr:MaoC/PaaZ C-terminal domain-containing protein [Nitrospira sp. KM1]BCA55715.1 hypothetical protein W02_28550 [Nitrospira sp. KM1]